MKLSKLRQKISSTFFISAAVSSVFHFLPVLASVQCRLIKYSDMLRLLSRKPAIFTQCRGLAALPQPVTSPEVLYTGVSIANKILVEELRKFEDSLLCWSGVSDPYGL